MALDFYSKHGIIIGTATILACSLICVTEMDRVATNLNGDDYSMSLPIWYKVQQAGTYILVALAVLLSFVLIFGIVKKRHLLLVPWLFVGFLLSAVLSGSASYETVTRTTFRLDNYIPIVVIAGLQIIVLYSMCHLFNEIRMGNVARGKPKLEPIKSLI